MTDNKCFNELVHYIDHDLLEVLTEEQREKIYVLAASSIALKVRHDTLQERADVALSGVLRTDMDYGETTPTTGVDRLKALSPMTQIFVAGVIAALIAIIIASIITL